MQFSITPEIFSQYPGLVVGCIVVRDMDNTQLLSDSFYEGISFFDGDVSEDPTIQTWREIYRSFGAKPKKHLCSLENLASYPDLYRINPLVDLYNGISLNTWLPYGAEDLDTIQGDIVLCLSDGSESFTPLGQSESHSPRVGEVIYRDDACVICRRWNWRESDITKITQSTKNACIVCEGFDREQVEKSLQTFVSSFSKYMSGNLQAYMLDMDHSSISLSVK